jgi:integrase
MSKVSRIGPPDFTVRGFERANCPADKRQIYLPDPKTRGLYLQVTHKGTKTFVYRRKIEGTWRQTTIGAYPDLKIEQARGEAATISGRLADWRNDKRKDKPNVISPFDEARDPRKEATLQDLFNVYVERHLKKSRKRVSEARKDFDRWFAPLANRKAVQITRNEAEKLHDLLAKERGIYAANRAVQLARAVYNRAKSWKLFFEENPFVGISLFKEKSRDRFLSMGEYARVIEALEDEPDETLRDVLWIAMLTAARKANVLSMRWEDIDLDGRTWTIPETKNSTSQVVPLTDKELEILKRRRQLLDKTIEKRGSEPADAKVLLQEQYVFPGSGVTGHLTDLKHSWTTFRGRAKIPDVTFHDLRRSLASAMASSGENVSLIKSTLHHKDLATTMGVYARVSKQAELEAKTRTQERIFLAAKKVEAEQEIGDTTGQSDQGTHQV